MREYVRVSCSRWAQHAYDDAHYSVSMAWANASKGGLPSAGLSASATLSHACIFRGWGLHRQGWGPSLSPCNGWLCLRGQVVIRAQKHDTRIFIRGHVVHEACMPSEQGAVI